MDLTLKVGLTVWYEKELKKLSLRNSKMKYLNVQISGLTGAAHPALHNIFITQDAKKLHLHLKFLTGEFLTNERLSIDQPTLSPACSLCDAPVESIEHVLVVCRATIEVRSRLLPELMNAVASVQPTCQILKSTPAASTLCQFILDCTSLNLPDSTRVPAHNPGISTIYRVSRDWCFAANSIRKNCLKTLRN